jgi:hypothetical protein
MGYVGILTIVLGIVITPSQAEIKELEMKMEYYKNRGAEDFELYEEDSEITEYGKAFDSYDRIKRQEVVAEHLVPIGLGLILLTISFAILRIRDPNFYSPYYPNTNPPPYPYQTESVRKKIYTSDTKDYEERK